MNHILGTLVVEQRRVVEYLLNVDHPVGGAKARYFCKFGFSPDQPEIFEAALLEHPRKNLVATETLEVGSARRAVSCNITSPDGRNPCILTVWQQEGNDPTHRLITARPIARKRRA